MATAITGLENLPIDVIECIANYLTSSELSNCCAVSQVWRNVFDNYIFWKKRFNKNITDYLRGAKCQVEPSFSSVSDYGAESFNSNWEDYLLEAHLWNNWSTGRFKLEEIEFDHLNDDLYEYDRTGIVYDIKPEFLTNDHVLLHRTFQIEVWDVSQKPILVMEIHFCLNEVWCTNYKVVGNRLVVVQGNVVQVFSICLESKTSNLDHVFFFDKSEEFLSLKLLNVNKVDEVFQETSYDVVNYIECIICGTFFIGVVTRDMNNLIFHVWDITGGKKLKEVACPNLPSVPFDVTINAGLDCQDKVIVVFNTPSIHCVFVFLLDLDKLHFVEHSQFQHSNLYCFILFDRNLIAYGFSDIKIVDYDLTGKSLTKNNKPKILKTFPFKYSGYIYIFNKKLLLSNTNKEILILDPGAESNDDIKKIITLDFNCGTIDVVENKFLVLHDMGCNLKEMWQIGEISNKIMSFPEDWGLYRAVNSACTRIVLYCCFNKLFILNFW